mgnify:CR=1 FL=1
MIKSLESFVDYTFQNGFFVSPDSLYKIKDIINNKLNDPDSIVKFTIERKDGFKFTTEDVLDIEREYNTEKDLIEKMTIWVDEHSKEVTTIFNIKTWESTIRISGLAKDITSLLYTDLKDYLLNDVFIFYKIDIKNIERYIPFLLMGLFFWRLIYTDRQIGNVKEILETDSVIEKLNYIIQRNDIQMWLTWNHSTTIIIFMILVLITILWISWWKIVNYIYPINIFYIGDQRKKYDKKRNLFRWIIWTIVVGLLVGLIVNWLSGKLF